MLPLKKPARAEKGLQDVSSRDGFTRPVLLAPLLQRPDLERFEPDSTPVNTSMSVASPAKDWVEGLNALCKGTVGLSEEKTQIKEFKRVDWQGLKDIALFRFRCGLLPSDKRELIIVVAPSILGGSNGNTDAGWVMEGELTPMDGKRFLTIMKEPGHEIIVDDDDGMTEIEGD